MSGHMLRPFNSEMRGRIESEIKPYTEVYSPLKYKRKTNLKKNVKKDTAFIPQKGIFPHCQGIHNF